MLEGKREVFDYILDLTDTMLEGMEHLKNRMQEGYFEDTCYLYFDIVKAIASIYDALEPLIPQLGDNRIEDFTGELNRVNEKMVEIYEQKQFEIAKDNMEFQLLPAFKKWKIELERCLTTVNAS